MQLQLDSQRTIRVGISHVSEQKTVKGEPVVIRGTKVWLSDNIGTYEATTLCSPQDNFSKRVGRRLAANRLLRLLDRKIYDKHDRHKIFSVICPEYGK